MNKSREGTLRLSELGIPTLDNATQANILTSLPLKKKIVISSNPFPNAIIKNTLPENIIRQAEDEFINFSECMLRITGKGNKTRIVPIGTKAVAAIYLWVDIRKKYSKEPSNLLFIG